MKITGICAVLLLILASGCLGSASSPTSAPPTRRPVSAAVVRREVSRMQITGFGAAHRLQDLRCDLVGAKARCVGTPSTVVNSMTVWFRIRPDGSLSPICDRGETRIYCANQGQG